MSGDYSVENPYLCGEPDLDLHPFIPAFRGPNIDLDYFDKLEHARTHQVRKPHRQLGLALFGELERKGEGYLDRARARWALAGYLRERVIPAYSWHYEYTALADTLEHARQHGLWGIGDLIEEDGNTLTPGLAVEWTGRVGQVKLCPDDAREESMRASSLYTPRIEELIADGLEVRFAVFTIPNSPRGFLAADLEAIYERLKREIIYRRVDGSMARSLNDKRRTFASLRGAVATLEAPLSRHEDWNVHLNVIMVFDARPDYRALREAWGANVQFQTVPTGAGAAALRELVKYPLKAISLKSEEKAAAGSRAPPVIEWPADAFHEWWMAHKGFRRTRSWGELYAGRLEERPRRQMWKLSVEWLGKVFLSPSGFRAQRPVTDTIDLDEAQEARARDRRTRDLFPEPSAQHELTFEELQKARAFFSGTELEAVYDAEIRAEVDLILGNKSAENASAQATGPPETTS